MGQPYVQPIVLRAAGTHLDACRAAALASVTLWTAHHRDPSWEPWLAGCFTKTVRRAKSDKALDRALRTGPASAQRAGDAVAAALLPTTYDRMDRFVRGLRVDGLELPREDSPAHQTDGGPVLLVNADLGMSTGKTAAQVAHGLFAWLLTLDWADRSDWFYSGRRFDVREVGSGEFDAATGPVEITDAGFTGVSAGTETVKVIVSTTRP